MRRRGEKGRNPFAEPERRSPPTRVTPLVDPSSNKLFHPQILRTTLTFSDALATKTAMQVIPLLKDGSPFTVITAPNAFTQQNAVESAFEKSGRPYTRKDSYDPQRGGCDKSVFRLNGAR